MASREALGGHLADRRWMARVLDETYDRVNELADAARTSAGGTAARRAPSARSVPR
jgi:hypothetical protein